MLLWQGGDNRVTMDMDTTIRNYNLSIEDAKKMLENIIAISLDERKKVLF